MKKIFLLLILSFIYAFANNNSCANNLLAWTLSHAPKSHVHNGKTWYIQPSSLHISWTHNSCPSTTPYVGSNTYSEFQSAEYSYGTYGGSDSHLWQATVSYCPTGYSWSTSSKSCVKSVSCPSGYVYDTNTSKCEFKDPNSDCAPGTILQHNKCVPYVCNITPPYTDLYGNKFVKMFDSDADALAYVNKLGDDILSARTYSGSTWSGFSDYNSACKNKSFLYVTLKKKSDTNTTYQCNNNPSLFFDGYPLDTNYKFKKFSNCQNTLNNRFRGLGVCRSFGVNSCQTIYLYHSSDYNNTDFDDNIDNNNNNNSFDNNFTLPNHVDDSNNSVNLNPVLGQIKQLSSNQHNDLRKLYDNSNTANHNLNTLINLIGGSSPKLSSIRRNTKVSADNSINIADNTKKISDSLTGHFDSSKIISGLKNAKDIFKNNDKNNTSNKDFNSSDVLKLYSSYPSKSVNALTSLFSHIDFGINNIFSIPNYNFVDIVFPPVDIDSLHLHLHGKILDASFFNSINFSLVKMFLLLLTLIWSAKYIFDRLF